MGLINEVKAKVVIKKLIEISLSTEEEATVRLLAEAGGATLSIDHKGNVELSGTVALEPIVFSGSPALKEVGVNISYASIHLYNLPGGEIGYSASIRFPAAAKGMAEGELSVLGSFDLVDLIRSNSGFSGHAYRALEGRPDFLKRKINEAMGY